MNNIFQIDGIIAFIDNTVDVSKKDKPFLVRGFGLDKPEFAGGQTYPNKIKFQIKGDNCKLPEDMIFQNEKYILSPGDNVVLTFGLSGMEKEDNERAQLAKENPRNYPGNPTGLSFGITNINCFKIEYAPGYVPNPANKVGSVPQLPADKAKQWADANPNTAAYNHPATYSTMDDLPF